MNLPKIDISSLPDLDTPTGVYGSSVEGGPDDALIILMTYLLENSPPGHGGGKGG